jgi:c-di-GMP-binding flagellar brake protein YcgR
MAGDKRLHFRKQIEVPINFEDEFGNSLIYLLSKDISLGGIFLDGDVPIKVGSQTFLNFILPGDSVSIRCTAKVVRIVREEEKIEGFGVQFVNVADIDRLKLENFIKNN